MRRARWLLPLAAAAFVGAVAPDARARPLRVDRPLALPKGDWAFDARLGIHHLPNPPGVP